ncbi:MAG: FAD-dependent oxidoreductase [Halobacteriales archaeon]|nr:FAD-dependent oxidoreductase [Halobacteriales archaeon]
MTVVVIGGGIVGMSSAYHLSERGADVVLIEKDTIGAGSSDRAAGGIRAQFTTSVSIGLSKRSIEVWERFDERFGVDIGYNRPGYLYLAREQSTADQIAENVRIHNDHDIPSRFVEPDRIAELCPQIRQDHYVGGTYCPTDGYADPHLALQGFYEAATDAGVDVRVGTAVTDLDQDPTGRVRTVVTDAGTIDAEAVVNAAGAWSPQIAAMVDIDLPVTPKRRQAIVVEPATPVPETVPFTTDIDTGSYFRPDGGGDALVGGHFDATDPAMDPDQYDRGYHQDWAADAIEHAGDVAGYFGPETMVKDGWAGLYAMTPDHHPIIEESVPGLITATGFSGHGFMQSPATGIVVAELIHDGAATTVDITPLDRNRFDRGDALHETFYSA